MTARGMRDLGGVGVEDRISLYGWFGAVVGVPAAYVLRRTGQQEVDALAATE